MRFADGSVWDLARLRLELLKVTAGADTMYATEANDVIAAGQGNDTIYGRAGNDLLKGEGGVDLLQGEAGDDVLEGGTGNDVLRGDAGADLLDGGADNDNLQGGEGNDVYVGGAGNDSLNDYSSTSNDVYRLGRGDGVDDMRDYGGADRIELGAGITAADVLVRNTGSDLLVSLNSGESLRVNSMFDSNGATTGYAVESVRFADGSEWDLARLKLEAAKGTAAADTLYGTQVADTLAGGEGNDILYGRLGNDTLLGDAGADNLQGEAGDDLLAGGEGNDQLFGGEGNDTYVGGSGNDSYNDYSSVSADVYRLGRGEGTDSVRDYGGVADRVELGGGVSTDQLWFRRVGSDLEVSIIGTGDRVHINSWYSGANYRIEQFITSDGQMLLDGQVQNLVDAMASFAPPAAGQTTLPDNYRSALGSTIAANWQPQG